MPRKIASIFLQLNTILLLAFAGIAFADAPICKVAILPDGKYCFPRQFFMAKGMDTENWNLHKRISLGLSLPHQLLPIKSGSSKKIALSITYDNEPFIEARGHVIEGLNALNKTQKDLEKLFYEKKIFTFARPDENVYFVCKVLLPDNEEYCFAYVPWSKFFPSILEFEINRQNVTDWRNKEVQVRTFLQAYAVQ